MIMLKGRIWGWKNWLVLSMGDNMDYEDIDRVLTGIHNQYTDLVNKWIREKYCYLCGKVDK